MVEPERALFLQTLPAEIPLAVTRIYAGAEFCPWRLPSVAFLREALHWSHARGRHFTLVTPVLIEPLQQRLLDTLQFLLPEFSAGDEVVISDWGALDLVRGCRAGTEVVLGRVLSGQKRDPRTISLDLSPAQAEHFRQGSWYSPPAAALLHDLGIRRVEVDNLLQGVAVLPPGLRGTLHVPYAMVASSRNCPFRKPGQETACPQPCGELFTLTTADSPRPLLQGGNTQFLHNDRIPAELATLGIDRVVEHLELPR